METVGTREAAMRTRVTTLERIRAAEVRLRAAEVR